MENFGNFNTPRIPEREAGSIISHALDLFKSTFLFCLLTVVIYFIAGFLVQAITGFDSMGFFELFQKQGSVSYEDIMEVEGLKTYAGASILLSFLLSPLFAGLVYIANKANFNQAISVSDIFFCYRQNFANIVIYSIITYILMMIAASLCFLPLFFVLPFMLLGYPIIIFENLGAIEALGKAFNIAKENYITLLFTTFLAIVISALGIILCCYGIYLTLPFFYIAVYSAYCAYCGAPRQL